MRHRLAHARPPLLAAGLLTIVFAWTVVAAPAQAHHVPQDQGVQAPGSGDPNPPVQAPGQPGWSNHQWPHPAPLAPPAVTTKTVAGKVAMMRTDGTAAIPRDAPKPVRRLIRQANRIIGKPYKWGGGHAKLNDRGYDCSGAVSFALIKAKLLESTMVSGAFKRWGEKGVGRYITVYARNSHVYMEIAGLRLDTSSKGDIYSADKGVRWRNVIGQREGFAVRHPAQL